MKFFQLLHSGVTRAFGCMALTAVAMTSFALSETKPAMSLEQMSKEADEIIVGNVLETRTKLVGKSFETDYKVQVHENLKSRTAAMPAGETVTLTLPGGVLQEPPITQYVLGAPYMYKGENVFLFLRKGSGKAVKETEDQKAGRAERSTLTDSYKVIGWNQGRFSVVARPNGEKVVTRVNLENYGVTNDPTQINKVVDAVAEGSVPTVEQPLARPNDLADDVRSKDPLEYTGGDEKKLKLETSSQSAAVFNTLRQQGKGIPVQSLNEFKAQVQSFVANN